MDKKLIQKIIDNIKWSKTAQNCWQGSFTLKDGYQVHFCAGMEMKMRESKSLIKECLPIRVIETAEERNIEVF